MKPRKPDLISQEHWDGVESPELTEDLLARLRPAREVQPERVSSYRRTRGPQKAPTKTQLAVRCSPEVVAYFRATGEGWQTRMDEALKQWIREHPLAM